MRHWKILAATYVGTNAFLFLLLSNYQRILENTFQLKLHESAPILSAYGTLSIALANLFLIMYYTWPDRPSLELEVLDPETREEPISPEDNTKLTARARVRVRVTNMGEVTATNCVADIEFPKKEWKPLVGNEEPIRPTSLHWNRRFFPERLVDRVPEMMDYQALAMNAAAPIDIRPRQPELLDVAFAPGYHETTMAQVYTARYIHVGVERDKLNPGSYAAAINVYADNANPKTARIRLVYTGGADLRVQPIDWKRVSRLYELLKEAEATREDVGL